MSEDPTSFISRLYRLLTYFVIVCVSGQMRDNHWNFVDL